jgi:hypothetical protein
VLGTLDAGERAESRHAGQREDDLDTAISAGSGGWRRWPRLFPRSEPPAGLFRNIEARLANRPALRRVGQMIELEQRVRRWRNLAAAASAVAACLLVVIGVREMVRPQSPSSYVAVFQKDDVSPAFLLSVDLGTRMLSIRMVAAERRPARPINCGSPPSRAGASAIAGADRGAADITRTVLTAYDPTWCRRQPSASAWSRPADRRPADRPAGVARQTHPSPR